MLDVIDQPAEGVGTVPRAFPFVHVAARAVRQDRHCRRAIRRPAHHAVLRADFFAGRRFAKPKNVNVKVEHVVVVRYAHGEMADTRKSSLNARRVKLMSGKGYGLPTGIGNAIVAMKKAALLLPNIRRGSEIPEPRFDLTNVFDGHAEMADAELFGAVAPFENRDIVKTVGERDISRIRASELAH